jgi:pyroglutamyl-peptidase
MSSIILLTGFGPFPGAPYNPTGPLVESLARRARNARAVRRVAHVFPTSYEAVDRELRPLIARERPDVVIMFGLAQRARHLRIETCASNTLSRTHADVAGRLPQNGTIAPEGPATLTLQAPAQRLVAAARAAGVSAALSRNAGSYLCNYLCWRASEVAQAPRGPRLVAFVHVPNVRPLPSVTSRSGGPPRTLGDLVTAGEAIITAALAAARMHR